jgi:hypothetical protein
MTKLRVVQIFVGVIGFSSALSTPWIAGAIGWSSSTTTIIGFGFAIGTLVIEMTLSFVDLREQIIRLYPSLDFSVHEQRQIYGLISNLNSLRESPGPAANIAFSVHEEAADLVARASQRSDFEVDNMFAANREALRSLRPGERFLGLSSIINPDHWEFDHDLVEYRKINYQQASIGVKISRVFILKNQEEVKAMTGIIKDQQLRGIDVQYILEENLPKSQFFYDFTVLPDRNFALFVPKIDKLLTCVATLNETLVAELETTFSRIKSKAVQIGS